MMDWVFAAKPAAGLSGTKEEPPPLDAIARVRTKSWTNDSFTCANDVSPDSTTVASGEKIASIFSAPKYSAGNRNYFVGEDHSTDTRVDVEPFNLGPEVLFPQAAKSTTGEANRGKRSYSKSRSKPKRNPTRIIGRQISIKSKPTLTDSSGPSDTQVQENSTQQSKKKPKTNHAMIDVEKPPTEDTSVTQTKEDPFIKTSSTFPVVTNTGDVVKDNVKTWTRRSGVARTLSLTKNLELALAMEKAHQKAAEIKQRKLEEQMGAICRGEHEIARAAASKKKIDPGRVMSGPEEKSAVVKEAIAKVKQLQHSLVTGEAEEEAIKLVLARLVSEHVTTQEMDKSAPTVQKQVKSGNVASESQNDMPVQQKLERMEVVSLQNGEVEVSLASGDSGSQNSSMGGNETTDSQAVASESMLFQEDSQVGEGREGIMTSQQEVEATEVVSLEKGEVEVSLASDDSGSQNNSIGDNETNDSKMDEHQRSNGGDDYNIAKVKNISLGAQDVYLDLYKALIASYEHDEEGGGGDDAVGIKEDERCTTDNDGGDHVSNNEVNINSIKNAGSHDYDAELYQAVVNTYENDVEEDGSSNGVEPSATHNNGEGDLKNKVTVISSEQVDGSQDDAAELSKAVVDTYENEDEGDGSNNGVGNTEADTSGSQNSSEQVSGSQDFAAELYKAVVKTYENGEQDDGSNAVADAKENDDSSKQANSSQVYDAELYEAVVNTYENDREGDVSNNVVDSEESTTHSYNDLRYIKDRAISSKSKSVSRSYDTDLYRDVAETYEDDKGDDGRNNGGETKAGKGNTAPRCFPEDLPNNFKAKAASRKPTSSFRAHPHYQGPVVHTNKGVINDDDATYHTLESRDSFNYGDRSTGGTRTGSRPKVIAECPSVSSDDSPVSVTALKDGNTEVKKKRVWWDLGSTDMCCGAPYYSDEEDDIVDDVSQTTPQPCASCMEDDLFAGLCEPHWLIRELIQAE